MCGINGIISKNKKPEISEINNMNNIIRHRGPDDFGILEYKNLLFGHVRLSIQDLSSKGSQPMSRDGKKWIIYNGEVYNFKEIKKNLESHGYNFKTKTDTEVILAAYDKWGDECVKKFNGMWVFAILDKEKNNVKIFRDRYGVKPCYFSNINNRIIFSSEIKGVLGSNEEFSIDYNNLNINDVTREKYFKTIFSNINIIEPGHIYLIELESLKIKKTRWWHGLENIPSISPRKKIIKENLLSKLTEASKIRLVSDVKIATSLSGGIDSSIIFSILNNLKDVKNLDLNPFILNYPGNKTYKAALNFTKKMNKQPILISSEENLNEDKLSKLDDILSSLEISSTYFNHLYLYENQKQKGFKVSIDGHGADECLAGYSRIFPFLSMQFINYLSDSYKAIESSKGRVNLQNKLKTFSLPGLKNTYILDSTNFFNKTQNITNKYTSGLPDFEIPDSFINDIKILNEFDYDFQIQYLEATYGNLQWLLNKWDKASMANSIEIRSPFLDWNFFQYALSIPGHLKIENGRNKSVLREAFKNLLPKEILELEIKQGLPRHKEVFDDNLLNFISNVVNEKDFQNHNAWDGKTIKKDFENNELRIINQKDIWEMVIIYLQERGYNKRIKNNKYLNNSVEQKFNLL